MREGNFKRSDVLYTNKNICKVCMKSSVMSDVDDRDLKIN